MQGRRGRSCTAAMCCWASRRRRWWCAPSRSARASSARRIWRSCRVSSCGAVMCAMCRVLCVWCEILRFCVLGVSDWSCGVSATARRCGTARHIVLSNTTTCANRFDFAFVRFCIVLRLFVARVAVAHLTVLFSADSLLGRYVQNHVITLDHKAAKQTKVKSKQVKVKTAAGTLNRFFFFCFLVCFCLFGLLMLLPYSRTGGREAGGQLEG